MSIVKSFRSTHSDHFYSVDPKIEDKISVVEKISTTHSPLFRGIHRLYDHYDQQQQVDDIIKIIFIAILILISLILLGSVIFGIVVCIRFISSAPIETVGTWNILTEDSKA